MSNKSTQDGSIEESSQTFWNVIQDELATCTDNQEICLILHKIESLSHCKEQIKGTMIKDILLALTYHNNPQLVESAKSTLGLIDQEFINTEISSFDGSIDEEPCKTCNIEYDINTGIKENIKLLKKNRNLNITKENGVEGIPNLLTRYQDCEPIKNFLRINSIDAFKSIFKSFDCEMNEEEIFALADCIERNLFLQSKFNHVYVENQQKVIYQLIIGDNIKRGIIVSNMKEHEIINYILNTEAVQDSGKYTNKE